MGAGGICKFVCRRLIEITVIVLLIVFLPNLPPYTSISKPYSVLPFKPLEGKLALNEKLNDVEVWHKGDLIGPEAFADYNGELYVSLYGGDIVKLTNNHITPIIKTGKPCKGNYEERICGRPLGIQFDKTGVLYAVDAYYGIFKIDVKTGEKTLIISVDQKIEDKKPKVPNSIALAANGDIYWSDSSTEFSLEDGLFDVLADPSGRLIHYDSKTKRNTVLINKLHFANGVALSDDEEFVIVAETVTNRIHRYYLKGPKKGTHDIFIDGLPGLPDNLKSDGKGGFFVPLIMAADEDHPQAFQAIGPFPYIRKFVARLLGLTQWVFELLNRAYPCEFAQKAIHFIGHFTSTGTLFLPKRTTILHVDRTGKILDSLHGLNNKINQICEVHIFNNILYLGSPFNDYIARVPLVKVGWEHLTPQRAKRDVPPEKPKVTQVPTTQRPTTTTTARPATTTTTPQPRTTTTPPPTTTTPRTTQTTTPRPTATTARPTKSDPPAPKQASPQKEQTPPPKTAPPPSKQTPPTTQQAPPAPKQTPPPPQKQQTPPSKQTPPAPKQTPPPPQNQQTPPKQSPPPARQNIPKQEGTSSQAPPPTQSPLKKSPPPVAQPVRDQPKSVPVNKNEL